MKWVTRERPKIDRIACPWLIARFIDREPEFLFVPPGDVLATARDRSAIPYDVPDVELTHVGEQCSFDAFLSKYRLDDPALAELAVIVRGADTARPELAPQAAGLLAISLGPGPGDQRRRESRGSRSGEERARTRRGSEGRHGFTGSRLASKRSRGQADFRQVRDRGR